LGTDPRENINCGQVVKAIILNGLGFVAQPLYLFPNFFKDKAVEHLLGEGVKAEELNDDKLGRVMDKLRYLQAFMCENISYVHWFRKIVF
jgi:transposase